MQKPIKNMSADKEEKKVFGLTKKQRSHVYTGLFILVFLIFFFVNNSFDDPEPGPYPPNYQAKLDPSSRDAAPYFELSSVDGNVVSIDDYKGKVILLNFWTSWSEPCRNAIPDFVELKREYGSRPFEIIGISLDTDTKDKVPEVVEKSDINYPVVYGSMDIARNYGNIQSIPTTFVIDKEGRIYSSYTGVTKLQIFRNDINKLLGE